MGTAAYRHCPQCGSEYQAWVERCFDCDVALGAPVSSDLPPPDIEDKDEQDRRTTSVHIDDLPEMQREHLQMLLRGLDIRFEMTADQLWFPENHAGEVDDLLDDVRGLAADGDSSPSRRRTPSESRARSDRRIVRPAVESMEDEPVEYVSAWPRGLAKVIDPWLTFVAQGGIGWLIRQEAMHRGPHDLMAHTFVVRSREPIRRRLISSARSQATRERYT